MPQSGRSRCTGPYQRGCAGRPGRVTVRVSRAAPGAGTDGRVRVRTIDPERAIDDGHAVREAGGGIARSAAAIRPRPTIGGSRPTHRARPADQIPAAPATCPLFTSSMARVRSRFGPVPSGKVQRGPSAAVPRRRISRPRPAPTVRRTPVRRLLAGGAPVQSRRARVVAPFMAVALLGALLPAAAQSPPASPVSFTILHTNNFHGQLEASGSNPGMARVATVVNGIRTSVGADKVLLVDAGDEMQGSLLSNLGGTQRARPADDRDVQRDGLRRRDVRQPRVRLGPADPGRTGPPRLPTRSYREHRHE